jgi:molybdopterin-guanine dinucleotide biosynthesis protein A
MPRAAGVSAIVLAGGRSSRFGRDKLAEPIDGLPLLSRAISAVQPVASEVIVVGAPDASHEVPSGVLIGHDPTPFEGPLMGLAAGLRTARHAVCLVVGGDSPSLVPKVLELLVGTLDDPALEAAALEEGGRLRPLPSAIRRDPGLVAADSLLEQGERRLRLVFEAVATRTVPEAAWRRLDPTGATLHDIDTPADIAGLLPIDSA